MPVAGGVVAGIPRGEEGIGVVEGAFGVVEEEDLLGEGGGERRREEEEDDDQNHVWVGLCRNTESGGGRIGGVVVD